MVMRMGGGPPQPAPDGPGFGRRELRVLGPYLRPHLPRAVVATSLLIVSQALTLATPFLIRYAIDGGIVGRDPNRLTVAAVLLAVTTVLGTVMVRAAMLLAGDVGERALRGLRAAVFDHMARLDIAYFEREKTGRLVARLTSDVETIELFVTEAMVHMVATVVYLLGSVTVLFAMDAGLAAASLGLVVPATVVAMLLFRVRSERAYNRVRERIGAVLAVMQETVRGVHVVQAFGRERFNATRFRDVNAEWREANIDSFRLGSVFFPIMEFVGVAGTIVVLALGGRRVIDGTLSIGTLTAFALYLASTLEPIQQLSQLYDTFQSAMSGLAKLAGVLEERPRVVDRPGAVAVAGGLGAAAVDDVTFRYGPDLPPALVNVDLRLEPGQTLALVGPTGAGKSTIAKLLLRFYDPTTGRVELDGRDLRDVRMASLRRLISVVPQEAFLFTGTIRDNIRFGRPDATDDEVETIGRLLEVDDAIRAQPHGYETPVRERGAALSGGQRQLIAIARALLADPRVLVLDEATSALDAATESRVDGALRLAAQGRTTIVIAHRLSTARRADTIAVVDHGRLAEVGTHDELVARGGLYAALYRHWLATN